jgi:hypothetical protein
MTNVSVRRSPFMERGNDPLIGLKIKLDRPIDRDRPCCRNICIIAAGKGPHAGELHCADCGQHRGWLSKSTAQWIEHVATRFGARTTPDASDFLLWHQGNSFALELKAPGDRPTEAQLEFLARFNEAGGHSACAEDVDRAVAVLESWQPLRGARRHPRTSFSGASPQCCGKDEATAFRRHNEQRGFMKGENNHVTYL